MLSFSLGSSQQNVPQLVKPVTGPTVMAQDRLTVSRPLHALIIDDNKDLARLFADILQVLGCTTAVASTGTSGLAMAEERMPDIIFCDLNMPGEKNGLDVAEEIRANSDFDDTRLIAITGFNDPHRIEEARAAGFESVFGKPIKFAQLKTVVENCIIDPSK